MIRCNHCGAIFDEDRLVLVEDDPSPSGICLPGGSYTYGYCPECGDDVYDDDYHLVDHLSLEEGATPLDALISYESADGRMWLLKLFSDEEDTLHAERLECVKIKAEPSASKPRVILDEVSA